ncbi:MAG: redoxin domain-containing protein [bacterium]|nr:redoxin domain-containing protein [bacterium]
MTPNWTPLLLIGALAMPIAVAVQGPAPKPVENPKPADDKKPTKLKVGSTVPATLALTSLDGDEVTFKDLREKVVILHFWSDRCPAERHANPIFMQMEAKYADSKDVVMIGVASNQRELGEKPGKKDDYKGFYAGLKKKRDKVGYKHTIYADHGNAISNLFQARSTPHCFVIDKKGVIQFSGALDDDPRGKKGKDATNFCNDATTAILAGKKPAVSSNKPYG